MKPELALCALGALDGDMDALLAYTGNAFQPRRNIGGDDDLSPQWPAMWNKVQAVCALPPRLELFASAAGVIPIVYPGSVADFEKLLREIVYKGRDIPPLIEKMGAQFLSGKTLRFIILSGKPYSGVQAAEMGLAETEWLEKSMIIRKHHECAHYYTKRFLGSSRNNLHDELIADFCGLYAAFGTYRAEWFEKFFDIRFGIYTKDLSVTAANVIRTLASAAAKGVEAWSKTEEFTRLDEAGRIEALAGKDLLAYVGDQKTC
ncbi:MAG: hypothetical protein FWG14_09415 [Peptococcaceae bacterium]|nr:hypothetical protein [Peptococcaceae bacterium]